MDISLKLILDELKLETDVCLPDELNPKFKSVEFYVASETRFAPDKLYVCLLSEAVTADRRDTVYFLCLDDRLAGEQKNRLENAGIFIVRSRIDIRELFNRVQRVFVKVTEWVMAMELSAAKREGFQALLDLSEPILCNFLTVQDSTFKLLAYTKNIEPPSTVAKRLVQLGYHPPETMEFFQKHRKIEHFQATTDMVVIRDRITSKFDIVRRTYHFGNSIYIIIVMDCCERPADTAVVELFSILLEYAKLYIELDIEQSSGADGVKTLALDIINSAVSEEEARIRSENCGYSFERGFRLYVFSFEDERNISITYHSKLLSLKCQDAVVFSWKNQSLMIEFASADIQETCDNSEVAIGHTDFKCGVSNSFGCLWDLPMAYEQSSAALDISSRLMLSEQRGRHERFCFFSEILVHHIVSLGCVAAPGVFENSLLLKAVALLREYDKQHKTDVTNILRLYLETERSATAVGEIMHLHRNTVLYHMQKISSLLGISLDDPEARLMLMLAFKAGDFHLNTSL